MGPDERTLRECESRGRHVRAGRVRVVHPRLPAILGWSGKWDDLPAAHFTSIAFDLLTLLGLFLVGLRFGGQRLGAVLAFAWAAYPFTQYVSNSNTNDALMPCFLVWGFWLVSRPAARGVLAALSGWTKFASLLVVPLWLTYPGRRPSWRFALGFAAATLAVFSVLLLEPDPFHEAHVFWTRTVGFQIGRDAPWSLWDWRQYHARGLPDLHILQHILQGMLVAGAVAVAFFPRRKSPLQLAALTAVLLAGFELVVTYWLYTYIPWFFPFAALALLAPAVPLRRLVTQEREEPRRRSPKRRTRTGRSPSRGRRSRTAWTEDRFGRRFGTCGAVTESGSSVLALTVFIATPLASAGHRLEVQTRRTVSCSTIKGPCSSGPLPPIRPSIRRA